jgi:hypothetical protein
MYLTSDPEVEKFTFAGLQIIDLVLLPWVFTCVLGYLLGKIFQYLKKESVKNSKETESYKRNNVIVLYVILFALNTYV